MTLRPTGRGLGIFALGLAATISAYAFGTPALIPLGAGMLALPALALALVALARAGVRPTRSSVPAGTRAGDEIRVNSGIAGRPRRPRLDALVVLRVDPRIGRIGALLRSQHGHATVRARRGIWDLPGPIVEVTDALGLARAERVSGAAERIVVPPRVVPLRWKTVLASGDGSTRRRPSPMGTDLDRVREYRAGDPLSHVHWAQTAKRGQLQTKVLAGQAAAGAGFAVALDARGACREDPIAFEEAVATTASLAHCALGAGTRLLLEIQADDGRVFQVRPRSTRTVDEILAGVQPGQGVPNHAQPRLRDEGVVGRILVTSVAKTPAPGGRPDPIRTIVLDPTVATGDPGSAAANVRVVAAASADAVSNLLGGRNSGAWAA